MFLARVRLLIPTARMYKSVLRLLLGRVITSVVLTEAVLLTGQGQKLALPWNLRR